MIAKLLTYQQDLEDSFKLDCSPEDVDIFKEAYVVYKRLRRQRKCVDKIKRLVDKYGLSL